MHFRKILLSLGLLCSVCLNAVALKTSGINVRGESNLTVWTFTEEIDGFINHPYFGYKVKHPNVQVDLKLIPTPLFPDTLDPVLESGIGAPDVFALEDAFIRKYVESGLLLPLDDLYEEVKKKMADYPIKIGSYEGHVYAMSWLIYPGAVIYRRSLAKKYLGTDDPVKVQGYLKSMDKLLDTARLLKKKSNGKCRIVSTYKDLFRPYLGLRKKPWVVNDSLYIDPAMEKYMDMCKTITNEKLDAGLAEFYDYEGQWSDAWYAGMNDKLADEKGNPLEVFCYFLPPWGLHYVLKVEAKDTSGDWAMCAGPSSWYWGGTWVAAYKDTKNPQAAKEMIRYLTSDDFFIEEMAKSSGEQVGNLNVQKKIKKRFTERYLSNQNHYEAFCEYAKKIDGSLVQGTDQWIEFYFNDAVTEYIWGNKSKQDALKSFKNRVAFEMGL